jgi:hypothetical protein
MRKILCEKPSVLHRCSKNSGEEALFSEKAMRGTRMRKSKTGVQQAPSKRAVMAS